MKLNLLHKILIAVTAAALIFCTGFFIGYSNGKTTINISSTSPSSQNSNSADSHAVLININTAGAEELELLPGIGPSLANAIIEYRENNGAFTKTEDIMNVKGISLMVYRSIQSLITV